MLISWSWNTSVSTANRLEAGQPMNQGSVPSKNKRALDPKKPDWLCCPPNLLSQ